MLVKRTLLLSAALLTGYLISPSYGGGIRIVVRHQRLAMLMGVLALLVAMSCLDVAQAVEFCGDGFCDSDEEASESCCYDCGCPPNQSCSDNICVVDPFCGDTICDSQEAIQGTCCEDCGCSPGQLCSDNICAVDPSPLFVDGFESYECPDPDGMMLVVTAESIFCVDLNETSRPDATIVSTGFDESMATSRRGVLPWSSISMANARTACGNAGKRLCTATEWVESCGGPDQFLYPYNAVNYDPNACNGAGAGSGTAGPTGARVLCVSPNDINDMSGNLEEWVEGDLTRGGSYEDDAVTLRCVNDGESPNIETPGNSVGFRCCANPVE